MIYATEASFIKLVCYQVRHHTETFPTEVGASELFAELAKQYSGPERHYHTLEHIETGLAHLAEMQAHDARRANQHLWKERWDLVRLAFWYHDFIIEPEDAETWSATFAEGPLPPAPSPLRLVVRRLVLSTCHNRIPTTYDAAYLCDADLAILGASEEDFDRYEEQIRAERQTMPFGLFARARIAVLERFRQRELIYSTAYGVRRWERQARKNLDRSIGSLRVQLRREQEE